MGWFEALFGAFVRRGKDWDGSERRVSLRTRCDFEVEIQAPGCRYLARVLDAGPQGLRMRVRGPWVPKVLRRSQPIRLCYVQPIYEAELDTVGAQIQWVKREGEQMFSLAVAFDDTLDNLKRSWVKPVLMKAFKMASKKNQRKTMRARCQLVGTMIYEGKKQDIKVTDLSTSGARVSSLQPMGVGGVLEVAFEDPHRGAARRRHAARACAAGVFWRDAQRASPRRQQ